MDSFNDWFNTYHHSQPTKPTLSNGATFTEKVAHEHRIKQYEAEMERWRHNLISQTKVNTFGSNLKLHVNFVQESMNVFVFALIKSRHAVSVGFLLV